MNELVLTNNDVVFTQGDIKFNGYESLMNQAKEVAGYIENIVVTEDNIKDVKKVLATSNKTIKELNDRRIAIRKELKKPYDDFAGQIKEIESVVNEANDKVKSKVKELEEKERQEKKETLKTIWQDKTQMLPYNDYITFERFFEERFSNKTFAISKYEEELNEFIEKTLKDINYLNTKPKEYLSEYLETLDLQETLSNVDRRSEIQQQIEEEEVDEITVGEEKAVFEITGKANIKLVEMLLDENEVDYRRVK